jgi:hypothetical protein
MELLELTGSQWPKRRRPLARLIISLLRSNRLRAKTVLAEQVTPAEHIGLLRPIKIVFGPFESNVAGRSFKKAGEVIPFGRRAFDILPTLLDWPGEIISKGDLIAKACRNGRRNLTFDDDTQAGGALHADQAVTKLSKRRCPSVIANFSILQL